MGLLNKQIKYDTWRDPNQANRVPYICLICLLATMLVMLRKRGTLPNVDPPRSPRPLRSSLATDSAWGQPATMCSFDPHQEHSLSSRTAYLDGKDDFRLKTVGIGVFFIVASGKPEHTGS